ncbi:hypothetical protein ACFVRU_53040, partial [Streptomyces sp. NPDC057927]
MSSRQPQPPQEHQQQYQQYQEYQQESYGQDSYAWPPQQQTYPPYYETYDPYAEPSAPSSPGTPVRATGPEPEPEPEPEPDDPGYTLPAVPESSWAVDNRRGKLLGRGVLGCLLLVQA